MAVVDPIADMLTRIRNALGAYHKQVSIPVSKFKAALAGILKEEGYITDFAVDGPDMAVTLKYFEGKPVITGLRRISKPGRRIYVGVEEIPKVQNGLGICILSTSQGILEGTKAQAGKVGGEILCEIW